MKTEPRFLRDGEAYEPKGEKQSLPGEGVEQAADEYVQSLPEEKWKCTSIVDVEKAFIAGASWDAGKKDAVEFAEWLMKNAQLATDGEYIVYKGQNFWDVPQLYTLFTNSKTP